MTSQPYVHSTTSIEDSKPNDIIILYMPVAYGSELDVNLSCSYSAGDQFLSGIKYAYVTGVVSGKQSHGNCRVPDS